MILDIDIKTEFGKGGEKEAILQLLDEQECPRVILRRVAKGIRWRRDGNLALQTVSKLFLHLGTISFATLTSCCMSLFHVCGASHIYCFVSLLTIWSSFLTPYWTAF